MRSQKVALRDVMVRFRLSYDKVRTLSDKLRELGVRLAHGYHPKYFEALHAVNLDVYEGDVVGVIGPNGGGKTTLLRTIGGIYHPDRGSVETHGPISTLLSLGTGFDTRLSGRENIRLSGLILGIPRAELEAKIPMIEEFAAIGEHIHVPMKYYSSGMIARIGFSIVLAMEPDILLIDEVFSVGDLQFSRKSARALRELLERATCQIIVTHSLDYVRDSCTRVIYVRGGTIVADGSPHDVVRTYERDAESPVVLDLAVSGTGRQEPA